MNVVQWGQGSAPPSPIGRGLVAGLGCSTAADAAEIIRLVHCSLAEIGATPAALVALASHIRKRDHPGLRAAAEHFDLPLCLLVDDELNIAAAMPSPRVAMLIGLPAIAEAAAAAAGTIVVPRRKSAHATCALALAPSGFDPLLFGQPVNASASMAASSVSTSSAGP